jgi:hypothetical protein
MKRKTHGQIIAIHAVAKTSAALQLRSYTERRAGYYFSVWSCLGVAS